MSRPLVDPQEGHPVPSTPFAGDGEAARLARREAWRRLVGHAKRVALVAVCVTTVGAAVSVYLAVVGTRTCSPTTTGERCVETSWYAFTLQPRARVETLDGVPDGERVEWYKDGQVWFAGRYQRGVKVGAWREYYPDGQPRFAGTYQAGALEGVETWWYPTGVMEWQAVRRAGKRHGAEVWYHPSGEIRREGSYFEGEKDGRFTVFRADGTVQLAGSYDKGKRLGGLSGDP